MTQFILYSYIFIAFGATALAYFAGFNRDISLQSAWYLALVFFSSLLEYNIHRFVKLQKDKKGTFINDWSGKHKSVV